MCDEECEVPNVEDEIEIESEVDFENENSENNEFQANYSYAYTVKIVNPERMSDFRTVDLGIGETFQCLESLRGFITKNLPDTPNFNKPDLQKVEMGYMGPGHGAKGRKVWLFVDKDLQNLYRTYQFKTTIKLWCYTEEVKSKSKKKGAKSKAVEGKTGESKTKSGSKYEAMHSEVDDTYEELMKRHQGKWSEDHLRTWAQMIRLKKHHSLDEAPDKPYFRGRKRPATENNQSPVSESKKTRVPPAISPGRKVNVRSELIDQLEKWHKLLDLGVIAQEEYDELRGKILSDIKTL